ncbi:MAG: hypothetical protein EPN94_11390 [Nitrospirae bacterium]|nr:MAG: hypothetical protein EPN94_11390 [Nitrospirota bacterium]
MNNNKINSLKRGVSITLKDENKTGTVIDWGIVVNIKRGFDGSEKELLLPSAELADSIRVRTNEGAIEIWPKESVELTSVF